VVLSIGLSIRYQFRQEECGECVLYVQTSKYINEKQVEYLEKSISQHLGGGLNIHIKIIKYVLLTERGKEKLIIQKTDISKIN